MKDAIMVTRALLPPYEEYCDAIKELWDTHWLTNMGRHHNLLEQSLQEYLGVANISLFTNGHMALELTLQAMQLQGEVITTPFTFVSTTHAIVRNGLTPVFCDIDPDTYTIDASKIEALITEKTCAIVPVHVYGNLCNVEEIERIAKEYNLKVIYDAAHAFGVTYHGKSVAEYGDASMFSFHATKVFNTIEGGAITFNDTQLEQKLYWLKNFGIRSEEEVDYIGSNAKMNEFQAIMGICNLRYIDEAIAERKRVINRYKEHLLRVKGIQLLQEQENVSSNYAYMPILIKEQEFGENRDAIYEKLKQNNIYARKYFYPLTNSLKCYEHQYEVAKTPVAEYVSKNILTLPIEPNLTDDEVDRICGIVLK